MARPCAGRLVVSVVLLAMVTAAAGCTDDEAPPEPTTGPTVPPSSSPTDAAVAAEQAAVAAYRGMWDAYVEAISLPDPELPALSQFAADDALTVLTDGLEQVERDGLAGRGDVVLDPEVIKLSPSDTPTTAEIADCVDTSGSELYRRDGEPYHDTPGGLRRAEAIVREVDSTWKVVGFALYGVGSCEG